MVTQRKRHLALFGDNGEGLLKGIICKVSALLRLEFTRWKSDRAKGKS